MSHANTDGEADPEGHEPAGGETVTVSAYIPAYQAEAWRAEADERGMSLSEYVASMTQAGRRGFDLTDTPDDEPSVAEMVYAAIREHGPVSYDTLAEARPPGVSPEDLEAALAELQANGRVRHSRDRGYVTVKD